MALPAPARMRTARRAARARPARARVSPGRAGGAVRGAVSLAAAEALEQKVIDLVADDVPQLLQRLDGRRLKVAGTERVLATAGVVATAFEPDWRPRFFMVI